MQAIYCVAKTAEIMQRTIKVIMHRIIQLKEDTMKKRVLLVVSFLLFGCLIIGCSDAKDALDVTFSIEKSNVFTVDTSSTTVSFDIDLNTNEDYQKYKDKIREIKIDFLRYSITSNTGNGGKADFYAGAYGGSFAEALKVAETLHCDAGELISVDTDVVFLNRDHINTLLTSGKLSIWAVAEGTDIHLIVPAKIKVTVTANPLE
jgi:hypothetical protein